MMTGTVMNLYWSLRHHLCGVPVPLFANIMLERGWPGASPAYIRQISFARNENAAAAHLSGRRMHDQLCC